MGCGDDTSRAANQTEPFTLVTFNTALGVGLAEYPEQRLPAIAEALAELSADVLCLQEAWQLRQAEALVAALAETYPHAYYSVAAGTRDGEAGPACDEYETELLQSCLEDSCHDVEPSGLAVCAVTHCQDEFTSVSSACQDCIVANQDQGVSAILSACGATDGNPAVYENQNGLVLLSRWPLTDPGLAVFDSALGDRGVLSARVETADGPAFTVHCTHLAATLGDVPYTGSHGSWDEERRFQIDQLLDVAAEDEEGSVSVLLGDMNCGPETDRIDPEDPESFARFEKAGYVDPYLAESAPRCTWCSDNSFIDADPSTSTDSLIDHVLLRSPTVELRTTAHRVLDERATIEVEGESVTTNLSDHYGVQVGLTWPAIEAD